MFLVASFGAGQFVLGAGAVPDVSQLRKQLAAAEEEKDKPAVIALRLAALFYRKRSTLALPEVHLKHQAGKFRLTIDRDWLDKNPLTATALREEVGEWEKIGIELKIPVNEGQRYKVASFDVAGNTIVKSDFLIPLFKIRPDK